MKKALLLLICFLSVYVAHGQEPAAPTQEWCEWAFQQIPDHRNISEVDSRAFSVDFHTLLKVAFAIDEWEQEKNPGDIGAEFLFYWYAGNGDSPLDDPDHSIQYKVGKVQDGKTTVDITIHTPSWPPEYHRFTMHLVFENDAWRIDDWFNWDYNERGFGGSMTEDLKQYIHWFGEEIQYSPQAGIEM
jgi:hypothetical protein